MLRGVTCLMVLIFLIRRFTLIASFKRYQLFIIAGFSLCLSLLFTNRWLFTELGLESFTRVWHYYVSYADFGFIRRGLLGTLLSELKVNSLIDNEYVFATAIHSVFIVFVAFLVTYFLYKKQSQFNLLLLSCVLFSPAFILQSGYLISSQDVQLLVVAMIMGLFVKRSSLFFVLGCIGLLMHEMFIFLLPALLLLFYYKINESWHLNPRSFSLMALLGLGLLAVTLSILGLSAEVEQQPFEVLMAKKLPAASVVEHKYWSGYFEIFSTINDNLQVGSGTLAQAKAHGVYLLLPLIYCLCLAAFISFGLKQAYIWQRFIIFACLLLPLFISMFAYDLYRWVGMSANLSLIYLLYFCSVKKLSLSKCKVMVILVFSLFSPFGGSNLDRPFPVHQMVLSKVL